MKQFCGSRIATSSPEAQTQRQLRRGDPAENKRSDDVVVADAAYKKDLSPVQMGRLLARHRNYDSIGHSDGVDAAFKETVLLVDGAITAESSLPKRCFDVVRSPKAKEWAAICGTGRPSLDSPKHLAEGGHEKEKVVAELGKPKCPMKATSLTGINGAQMNASPKNLEHSKSETEPEAHQQTKAALLVTNKNSTTTNANTASSFPPKLSNRLRVDVVTAAPATAERLGTTLFTRDLQSSPMPSRKWNIKSSVRPMCSPHARPAASSRVSLTGVAGQRQDHGRATEREEGKFATAVLRKGVMVATSPSPGREAGGEAWGRWEGMRSSKPNGGSISLSASDWNFLAVTSSPKSVQARAGAPGATGMGQDSEKEASPKSFKFHKAETNRVWNDRKMQRPEPKLKFNPKMRPAESKMDTRETNGHGDDDSTRTPLAPLVGVERFESEAEKFISARNNERKFIGTVYKVLTADDLSGKDHLKFAHEDNGIHSDGKKKKTKKKNWSQKDYKMDGNTMYYTKEAIDMRKRIFLSPIVNGQIKLFWNTFGIGEDGSISQGQYTKIHSLMSKALDKNFDRSHSFINAINDWRRDLTTKDIIALPPKEIRSKKLMKAKSFQIGDGDHEGLEKAMENNYSTGPKIPNSRSASGRSRSFMLSNGRTEKKKSQESMNFLMFRRSIFEVADLWTDSLKEMDYAKFLFRLLIRISVTSSSGRAWKSLAEVSPLSSKEFLKPLKDVEEDCILKAMYDPLQLRSRTKINGSKLLQRSLSMQQVMRRKNKLKCKNNRPLTRENTKEVQIRGQSREGDLKTYEKRSMAMTGKRLFSLEKRALSTEKRPVLISRSKSSGILPSRARFLHDKKAFDTMRRSSYSYQSTLQKRAPKFDHTIHGNQSLPSIRRIRSTTTSPLEGKRMDMHLFPVPGSPITGVRKMKIG